MNFLYKGNQFEVNSAGTLNSALEVIRTAQAELIKAVDCLKEHMNQTDIDKARKKILKSSVCNTFVFVLFFYFFAVCKTKLTCKCIKHSICFTVHIYLPFIDFMILWLHGESGTGPAKFSIPHSVTLDSLGRVKTVSLCREQHACGWVGMSRCKCLAVWHVLI